MRRLMWALAGAAALAWPAAAAIPVQYSFTALSSTVDDVMGTFTWTAPDFLTGSAFVTASQLESCSVTFGGTLGVCRHAAFTEGGVTPDSITFGVAPDAASPTVGPFYFFQADAFAHFGTYDSIGIETQRGRLEVSKGAVVPEPAAWALMIAGFGLAGAGIRRRRARPAAA